MLIFASLNFYLHSCVNNIQILKILRLIVDKKNEYDKIFYKILIKYAYFILIKAFFYSKGCENA